jgi:hypothetical protein
MVGGQTTVDARGYSQEKRLGEGPLCRLAGASLFHHKILKRNNKRNPVGDLNSCLSPGREAGGEIQRTSSRDCLQAALFSGDPTATANLGQLVAAHQRLR